jgi:FG-GAP-like repeat/ASPIC and UnbV
VRLLVRILFASLFCAGVAAGVIVWVLDLKPWSVSRTDQTRRTKPVKGAVRDDSYDNESRGRKAVFDVVLATFEDGGYRTAMEYMAPIRDPNSLQDLREAVRGRGRRGLAVLRPKYDKLHLDVPPTSKQLQEKLTTERAIGFLHMYEGRFVEAAFWLEKALESSRGTAVSATSSNRLLAVLGIIAMRRGEIENCLECVGPSSCIFPLAPEAVHRNQAGSREAIRWFTAYLHESPRDLRIIWLLNIAYMTLGEHPEKVPPEFLLPASLFRSKINVGRFENVAAQVGLTTHGPNLAGGSVFDDFTGDGLPDLFSTSLDADLGASLYINRGNGMFEDRSAWAGLSNQVYALNVARADFDNDGDLDVLLLRGGWEKPLRLSLLRNRGDGIFDDVTVVSGLAQPIATESASWGDYDNDGLLDVFVCGEYLPPGGKPSAKAGDPNNRCRLYHNQGGGRFVDVAAKAGVINERCAKGSAWGDYDGDGRLDLFVSNMGQECRLYHNEGDGTFRDMAPELGVTGAEFSFACWFWDYDNDGLLDLYVNDYRARVAEVLLSALKVKIENSSHPRLYRNLGSGTFREVSLTVGLDRAMAPMGANFGDIDNDGFLDIYLGTGDMSYEGLDVNLLFKNVEGSYFEDVTTSSGTGHLQKGHGVSFADWDCDGDLDLFVELGGATPGDQAYNALFQNPGDGRHWLKLKLIGTKTNRSAIGAKIQVELKGTDGATRFVFRVIGNNGSFGGNPLVELVGLGDAKSVARLTVSWPTSKTSQTFHNIAADQAIQITEGTDTYYVLHQQPLPSPSPAGRSTNSAAFLLR